MEDKVLEKLIEAAKAMKERDPDAFRKSVSATTMNSIGDANQTIFDMLDSNVKLEVITYAQANEIANQVLDFMLELVTKHSLVESDIVNRIRAKRLESGYIVFDGEISRNVQ